MSEGKKYTVTDGDMVLVFEPNEDGVYTITSPFDPGIVTEARTIEEGFEMARDAAETLHQGRQMWYSRLAELMAQEQES